VGIGRGKGIGTIRMLRGEKGEEDANVLACIHIYRGNIITHAQKHICTHAYD
jgi:hypothetical protein